MNANKIAKTDSRQPADSARYVLCPRCEGEGTHDNENFDGFTAMDREDWDDFGDSYRRGDMSVQCSACKGLRVMTHEQVAEWEADVAYQMECRAESWSYANGY